MKCVKSIKSTKQIELGVIKRVDDREAMSMVSSGYWEYTSKTEYKKYIKPTETQEVATEIVTNSKKQKGKKN